MAELPRRQFLSSLLNRLMRGDLGFASPALCSPGFGWALVVALALATAALSTLSFQQFPSNLREGTIASRNIKADRNYEILDEEATQKFRDEAVAGILSVYDLDEIVLDDLVRRMHEAFALARELLAAAPGERPKRVPELALSPEARAQIEFAFSEKLGILLTPSLWQALWGERFSERLESAIAKLLRRAMARPVVAERGALDAEKDQGIVLRRLTSRGGEEERLSEEKILSGGGAVVSLEEARQQLAKSPVEAGGLRSRASSAAATQLAQFLVEPNCSLNRQETEARKATASANVKSVFLKVNAGEMIIREGSRFEPWHLKVLEGIRAEKRRGMASVRFGGAFLLIFLLLVFPLRLALRRFARVRAGWTDLMLMALVGLAQLALMRLWFLVAPALHEVFAVGASARVLLYAVPAAGGAMLLSMFLSAELAVIFAIILSIISGLFLEADVGFVAFCLLSNVAAISAIARADRRSLIMKAGILTGAAGAVVLAGVGLVAMASATEVVTLSDALWSAVFAFVGGIGSAFFAMILAPVVELAPGYTSDIKLLELANLNHPLLRELIVRAPGTYHHSHMVGLLGEAAAEAIGAKALLVRVGAYYHDIGKIRKPLYFAENARSGESKHERLTPHMSALIVASHVKEGQEMVERSGVPRVIAEMIPEHHGTRLISFFYEKAKEQEDAERERVDPKDFCYAGPKPQTREAAILMLADAAEAAVRSLKEKSTTRIQQTVQRVITDIFTEKQLDECELTLRDLHEISRAFVRTLLGIYHSRIEYPKDTEHDRGKPEVNIVDDGPLEREDGAGRGGEGPPRPGG